MAAALLLVVFIAASFTVVRIGAAALELTGLPWEQAKFQALSAFTNAGFTTKESEQITGHPARRRITTYLIVLGNAGLVTTIGSFAGSVMQTNPMRFGINIAAIAVGVAAVLWVARRPRLAQKMRDSIQRRLVAKYGQLTASAEELLRYEEGYVLTKILLPPKSPAVGKMLSELSLKTRKIQILAIERGDRFIPIPGGTDVLKAGDNLVIYGARAIANDVFHPRRTQALTIIPEAGKSTEGAAPPTTPTVEPTQ